MYVVVVYDAGSQARAKLRCVLARFLNHTQESVFEGELSKGNLARLSTELQRAINSECDSVIIYSVNNPLWMERSSLGRSGGTISNILC